MIIILPGAEIFCNSIENLSVNSCSAKLTSAQITEIFIFLMTYDFFIFCMKNKRIRKYGYNEDHFPEFKIKIISILQFTTFQL